MFTPASTLKCYLYLSDNLSHILSDTMQKFQVYYEPDLPKVLVLLSVVGRACHLQPQRTKE